MRPWSGVTLIAGIGILLPACRAGDPVVGHAAPPDRPAPSALSAKVAQYSRVKLTTDVGSLSEGDRRLLPILIDAARWMDTVYQLQYYPARDSLVAAVPDSAAREYIAINYGPWDLLDGDHPFVAGVGPRPPGVALYPHDMTKEEFDRAASAPGGAALRQLYTVVRRDSAGGLTAIPYHVAYRDAMSRAAAKLREAAALAADHGFRAYLELRARALETDDYRPSDLAWLDMKHNALDIVIGPIETYADKLYGYKAGAESYVLVKDTAWSRKLARYASLLPALQRGLPVPAAYKRERPGTDSDLNAYDAVFYAGEANAGSKTIAINLPNDEEVQLHKGTRRLQLKNVMRAKFDRILLPIAKELIASDQLDRVEFDAFFDDVMFHEVAHGLGIKHTVDGRSTVRAALKDQAGALEEGKADILGLYLVTRLLEQKELTGATLEDHYVTFLASILRSIRFGAAEAHGRANAAQFAYFQAHGAVVRDSATGRYRVDVGKMGTAVDSLGAFMLRLQGDGDYDGARQFLASGGELPPTLRSDLARLTTKGIPVDVMFEQGPQVLTGEH